MQNVSRQHLQTGDTGTSLVAPASNVISAPVVTFFVRKDGLRSLPLGRERLCRPPWELLGKQTSSTKAERRRTRCKRFQGQLCHQFGDVVLTTLVPRASKCHFCRIFNLLFSGEWATILSVGPWTIVFSHG